MRNVTVGICVSTILAGCGGGGEAPSNAPSTTVTPASVAPVKDPLKIVAGTSYDANDQGGNPRWVIADFNKDGIKDIFLRYDPDSAFSTTTTGTSPVRFFLGKNAGGFEQSTSIFPQGFSPTLVTRIISDDFNGDGGPDIFIATSGQDPYVDGKPASIGVTGGYVQVLTYSPNGYVLSKTANVPLTFAHHASSGDINSDYLSDILVDSLCFSEPFFILGDSNGNYKVDTTRFPKNTFTYQNNVTERFTNGSPKKWSNTTYTASALVDANNDGRLDVVMFAAQGTNGNIVYLNDGSGNFSNTRTLGMPTSTYGSGYEYFDTYNGTRYSVGTIYLDTLVADINNDGKKDIVAISTEANQSASDYVYYRGAALQILINTGNGFVDETATRGNFKHVAKNNYTHYDTIEYADVNNDKCKDILLHRGQVNAWDTALPTRILINDCKGNFTEKPYPKNLPVGILTVIGEGHYAILVNEKQGPNKYTQRVDDVYYDWSLGQSLFP